LVEHLTVNQVVVSSSLTAGVAEMLTGLVNIFYFYANLAQSVEHLPRKEKVGGSIPLVGIFCVLKAFYKSQNVDIKAFLILEKH
jgi:hypothetical protein